MRIFNWYIWSIDNSLLHLKTSEEGLSIVFFLKIMFIFIYMIELTERDVAIFIFTSGTTGLPKAAR